ncbi:ATP synthase F0 subunit C [Pseudenhygromyxa sp. WMMC2535]|uniref:ATP synthase F0 subunit C n=1 Tax=Pseudenhygromyxa sp. WMMC2535 TaxID=2712867 RepID=UPI0015575FBA|nr:ATP synthase F0 subunit C [Pseudenhygromyxa sp. WMMC2535]NVB38011.1 ATP synthase F0 subunit C [Pseudenhygromyxa sp. WMMC2535]
MKRFIAPLIALMTLILVPGIVFAAAPETGAAPLGAGGGIRALGLGLAMGLAVLGGGLGQGRAASTALEGICRNPSAAKEVFTPMLLGLAFVESLVIFAFVSLFII